MHEAGGRIAMQILRFGRYAHRPDIVAPRALQASISAYVPHALTDDGVESAVKQGTELAAAI